VQLEFPAWNADALRRRIEELSGERIHLALTDNASTMMSFKPARARTAARLRLHHMFLSADSRVIEALAAWMAGRGSRRAGPLLDAFIAAHQHLVTRRAVPVLRLLTRGLHHDLQTYYDDVNSDEFDDSVDAPITWGRLPTTRRRRSIRLGSYSADDSLIRIHPHLDQPWVPDFFVRYIVFHEMLHAHIGIEVGPGGRRRIHTHAFSRRERAYRDFARAMAWHDDPYNLARLLRPAKQSA
jgi:hypothetical protein